MENPFYEFEVNEDAFRFEFKSVGPKVTIPKAIIYRKTTLPNFYNLAMGDVKSDRSIDVFVESNNGDMEMVLATVVQTILVFLAFHPDAKVIFTGSTAPRTRLYQIAIAKDLDKIEPILQVLGLHNDRLEKFELGKNYEGFVISKKNIKIEV